MDWGPPHLKINRISYIYRVIYSMQENTVERAEVGQLETNCGECMDSDIGVGDPEIVDM